MTATLKLYEAVDALDVVRIWIDEHDEQLIAAGGDLDALPELKALLEQAEGDFKSKAERVALFVRELLVTSESIDAEAKRLAARAGVKKRAVDGLKQYLLNNMVAASVPKIEGTYVTLRVQNSPPSVQCAFTSDDLARHYAAGSAVKRFIRRIPESFALDAAAVKETSKIGSPLPDGITVTQGVHLRIV